MIGSLFNKTNDFVYLSIPIDIALDKFSNKSPHITDPCVWDINAAYDSPYSELFRRLYWNPFEAIETLKNDKNNLISSEAIRYMSDKAQHYPGACLALVTSNGFWNLKLAWVQGALGSSARVIYAVRDPRSWVAYMINSKQYENILTTLKELFSSDPCATQGIFHPAYTKVKNLVIGRDLEDPVKLLAHLWYADTSATLDALAGTNDYLIVRVEDLVAEPENTAEMIFAFTGMPFSTAARHYVLQMTRSNDFKLPFNEQLRPTNLNFWHNVLTGDDIESIESITMPLMTKLDYKPA